MHVSVDKLYSVTPEEKVIHLTRDLTSYGFLSSVPNGCLSVQVTVRLINICMSAGAHMFVYIFELFMYVSL